jgi:hypothetical protein
VPIGHVVQFFGDGHGWMATLRDISSSGADGWPLHTKVATPLIKRGCDGTESTLFRQVGDSAGGWSVGGTR